MALFFSFHPFQKAPVCQGSPAPLEEDRLLYAEATVVSEHEPLENGVRRDIEDNRIMAAIAYLGPLCLIPYFAAQHSPFARKHAVRGVNLFLAECIYFVGTGVLQQVFALFSWQLELIFSAAAFLCGLVFPVLSFLSFGFALRGENKRIPVVERIRFVR